MIIKEISHGVREIEHVTHTLFRQFRRIFSIEWLVKLFARHDSSGSSNYSCLMKYRHIVSVLTVSSMDD